MKEEKICLENPTIKSVELKYRNFVEDALDKLTNHFKSYSDTWDLRVYHEEFSKKNNFGKYVLMLWEDPYEFKISIYPNERILFELEDTDSNVMLLERNVLEYDNKCPHIGEIDFFIDSIENVFAIQNKLHKFTSDYRSDDLPNGYKRNGKIEQLLM